MRRVAAGCFIGMTLLLAGCTDAAGGPHHLVGTVRIGADLPLSGDDAPDGLPVRNAIELAVKQAGQACGLARHQEACVQLEVTAVDDVSKGVHDAASGAVNVQRLAADDHLIGMVGPLYDSLARSELPVANRAGLAMISPAATDECLTQEPSDGHCHGLAARLRPRSPNNFFRVVTTQSVQGAGAADLGFRTLGKRRAFVLNDQTAAARALTEGFVARFSKDGGVVLDPSDLGAFDPAEPIVFGPRIQRAAQLGADVVYVAAVDVTAAAAIHREMTVRLPQVPLIGNDSMASAQFARFAGADAHGCYYTVVGPAPAALRQAAAFLRDYRAAYGSDAGRFSLPAFDATNLLIRAVSRAIDDTGGKLPGRADVLRHVGETTAYRGAMGETSFDSMGDTSLRLISAYQWLAATDAAGQFVAQLSE